MAFVIRDGAFETNSSSSHSISITDKNVLNDIPSPNELGQIEINFGEFGWEFDSFHSFWQKASYIATDLFNGEPETLKDNKNFAMFCDVIKEATGAKEVILVGKENDYYPRGYVDHQSAGTSLEAFDSKDTLKRFLFARNSSLETGNDNV